MSAPPHSLAALRQPALMYDADGRVAAANDLAEALAGRPLAALSSAEVIRTFRHRWPDRTPLRLAELPAHRALAGEEVVDVPLVITVADGRDLEILATASPIREGDAIVGALVVWQDVTERKRAEAELARSAADLRDSRQELADAIAATGAGYYRIALTEPAGTISPRGAEILGFSTAEMPSLLGVIAEAGARMHPDDFEEVITAFTTFVEADTERNEVEFRVRTPEGGWRWVRAISTSARRDETGRVVTLAGLLFDIDTRRRAGEALRASEERLRLAQDAAGIGIWDRDITTDRVTVTPGIVERYGLDGAALGTYADWARLVHPDDRVRMEAARDAAIAAGEPLDLEFRAVVPSGEVRWIQLKGGVVPESHCARARVLGVIIDITERKRAEEALAESEEKYRNLVDLAPDAILIHRDGAIVFANPAAAALVGVGGPGDLVGQPVLEIVHPGTRRHVEWNIEADLRGDESPITAVDLLRPDGTTVTVQGRGAMIPFGGRPAVQVVLRDVSEEKRAEAERARFTEELERSNEELQRFAYVASHDLQEPLRSIISFSQLLERRYRGRLDEDADEFIAFIVEGGNRMQRLIEDLLRLSRVATQARPLAPTDAGEVVADVLRSMETAIREADATVTVEALPRVMADAAQLAQVFANLVSNALKYRRPDLPAEVRISAEPAGKFWRFAVADNGIGIEAEYFGRIFEMFRRLHTHDEYEGTGIGLAVVKKIVERHGGRVRVESTPGEGSTFFFTLPAA